MYLPTEPDVILAQRAMATGCAPDCWHCRFWARQNNAPFPFTAARALAASPSPGRRSAVDGRGGDTGGTQGDRLRHQGSGRVVQAPPTSEAVRP